MTARAQRARVLVLCADIGEGHVTVARALAADLAGRGGVAAVDLRNGGRGVPQRTTWTRQLSVIVPAEV